MKVGVEVVLPADAGELFADARALEGAGVDSFWTLSGSDQLVVLGAIAAVTWRARIVAVDADQDPALATLERLARGRLALAATRGGVREIAGAEGTMERWARVAFPSGRAAWRETRTEHEAEGTSGLVLPNDPRLLDLLRNPDLEDDRQDLRQAFG